MSAHRQIHANRKCFRIRVYANKPLNCLHCAACKFVSGSEMASRWLSALSKWHKITVQPKPLFSTLHFDCISSLSTLQCYREAFLREKRHFVFHSHLRGHHWKGEKRDQLRLGLDADFHLCSHKVTEMRMLQCLSPDGCLWR